MKTIFAVLLASSMAVPAFAGGIGGKYSEPRVDQPIQAPALAPARYNWTGPYAGLTLGYGEARSNAPTGSASGAIGGLHFGYNQDMGNWVLGGELVVAPKALTRISTPARSLGTTAQLKVRAGPKLGVDGRTFAFGTLGAAYARSSSSGPGGPFTDTGPLIGVGASHAIQDNWLLTGEITHARFKNAAGTTNDVNVTGAALGVSLRF